MAKNIQYISKLVRTKEVEFHCLITFPKNKTLLNLLIHVQKHCFINLQVSQTSNSIVYKPLPHVPPHIGHLHRVDG